MERWLSESMLTRMAATLAVVGLCGASPAAQKSTGPDAGTLIVDGGGGTKSLVARFVETAGGKNARIVVFATGPSALRFGRQSVLNPDWPRDRPEWQQYEEYLKDWLGVPVVQVLHTRDRSVANSDAFTAPLKSATGVYLIAGNAGRYADAYLNTRTQSELEAVLARRRYLRQFRWRDRLRVVPRARKSRQAAVNADWTNHRLRVSDERRDQSSRDVGAARR